MGLIQSCLGKKSNKVGVLSEEEEEAYGKIEEETKKEMEDDIIHTKPLPWLMFCTEPSITKGANTDEEDSSTVTEVVQKKGGVSFSIEYKSTVPKLPPINLTRKPKPPDGEDYDIWKGMLPVIFLFCVGGGGGVRIILACRARRLN